MAHILVVFTGGTIGSTTKKGRINTSNQQAYKLIDLYEYHYADTKKHSFKLIQPIETLSENISTSFWTTLINAIEAENLSQFDGIIITHGTDTLAFTAAALSLYFNAIKIPLLLVSSDYPLEHSLANGLNNFHCAIEFIKQRKEAGVFVAYKNNNCDMLVHLGSRIASCLQLSSDFISVQSKAYLSFKDNQFHLQNTIDQSNCQPIKLLPLFNSNILLIKPYPGLNYQSFSLDNVDAVLHDLYHSGTACSSSTLDKNFSLIDFLKTCHQKNISVYLAPAIKNNDCYDSTHELIENGAQIIWNISLEVAYIKILLAYSNFKHKGQIDLFLKTNIASEIVSC